MDASPLVIKRLFLFAAYDCGSLVPRTDIHYVKALSKLGDVLFFADNALEDSELEKLRELVLYAGAGKHGEYDFGSYKRCWLWAKANLDLDLYDFVYLVNDSVVGPLRPLEPVLAALEKNADVTGMCRCPKRRGTHIQSWFVGVSKKVFTDPSFDAFLQNVSAETDKRNIYIKYENGLTTLLEGISKKRNVLLDAPGKSIYNRVEALFDAGLPFMKKSAFVRHGGSLGRQTGRVLDRCGALTGARTASELKDAVKADLDRLHGEGYFNHLTQATPLETASRYLKYLVKKVYK